MITIETINGKQYTVVWRGEPENLLGRRFTPLPKGTLEFFLDFECLTHLATALPALPKYPKPKDARLLHRYAAEGLDVIAVIHNTYWGDTEPQISVSEDIRQLIDECQFPIEITHATFNGERVEVAIEG